MNKNGFTLIETLSVVLIVLILAAMAWPIYQRAVLKSRYNSLIISAKPIADAQEVFYFANEAYAQDRSALAASVNPDDNEGEVLVSLSAHNDYKFVLATREEMNNNYIIYQNYSPNFPGEIHCEAKVDDDLANWLCEEELNGTLLTGSLTPGYNEYVIVGEGHGTPLH